MAGISKLSTFGDANKGVDYPHRQSQKIGSL